MRKIKSKREKEERENLVRKMKSKREKEERGKESDEKDEEQDRERGEIEIETYVLIGSFGYFIFYSYYVR